MSVKELKFEDYPWKISISGSNKVIFRLETHLPTHGAIFTLDRNQAHLLKLWLEEHLK